ncbi:MAG: PBP1A family penicillin-binding protein [bacterium]
MRILILLISSALIGIFAGVFASYISYLPSLAPLEYQGQEYWSLPTRIYSEDNELIGEFAKEKRWLIKIDKLPSYVKYAFISSEDASFYKHPGINVKGIIRATCVNFTSRRIKEGGSSITQQLAKNLFLTQERTIKRKIQEILLALKIERHYTKDEILERYLNKIYFGKGVYGIEAASRFYFNKEANSLSLSEASILAGMVASPNTYSPFTNPSLSITRGIRTLERMADDRYITKEKRDKEIMLLKKRIEDIVKTKKRFVIGTTINKAPYFIEYLRKQLEQEYGYNLLYQGGLSVSTTLNLKMQREAELALSKGLNRLNMGRKDKIEGALLAIEPTTGKIRAMVGGSGFSVRNQLNRTYQTIRQPGSAFKPIIYAAAIDSGWTLADTILDEPISYPGMGEEGETWIPQNYEGRWYGRVTVRKALEDSINIPTIKILDKVGPSRAVIYATRLGITSELHPYLSLALGAFDTSMMDMAVAFSVFANGGLRIKPYGISEVKDRNGNFLKKTAPFYECVLSKETAYIITSALKGVIERGTAQPFLGGQFDCDIAGKTGTTDECVDAWFIGYTPNLLCAVWVGYDRGRKSMGKNMTGAVAAAPIFLEFMKEALKEVPKETFQIPDGIVFLNIDRKSGRVLSPEAPGFPEVFIAGTEPERQNEKEKEEERLLEKEGFEEEW